MDVINKKNEKNIEKCHSSYGFNNKEDNSNAQKKKNHQNYLNHIEV